MGRTASASGSARGSWNCWKLCGNCCVEDVVCLSRAWPWVFRLGSTEHQHGRSLTSCCFTAVSAESGLFYLMKAVLYQYYLKEVVSSFSFSNLKAGVDIRGLSHLRDFQDAIFAETQKCVFLQILVWQ